MEKETEILIAELKKLLNGGGAHVGLKEATAEIPYDKLGARPYDLPYSIWQLVEHIKIAQWDMLEFSKSGGVHQSPKWPDEYWPKETAPEDQATWHKTLKQIADDLQEFIELVQTRNLFENIPHGDGQSILREALQIADHTTYHIAEIIVIRRLLGIWKS